MSRNLTESINSLASFAIKAVPVAADPVRWSKENEVNTVLVIERGYGAAFEARLSGKSLDVTANLTVYYDPTDSSAQTKVAMINSVVLQLNRAFQNGSDMVALRSKETVSHKIRYIDFFAPGVSGMAVMTLGLFNTVSLTTELRERGILKKLASTPITRLEWMVSNQLFQLVMGVISAGLVLGVGYAVFDLHFSLNIWFFLLVLLTSLTFSGIGLIVGRYLSGPGAHAAANAVIFPMMFLSGTFFPLEMMPDFLRKIAYLLPLYYINQGLRAALTFGEMESAMQNTATVAIFSAVVFALGYSLTRWNGAE